MLKNSKKNDSWLLEFSSNFHSQKGEDGILEKVIEIIGDGSRWCVEFGAWDGKHFSNTYNLMLNKFWRGVFIEPHKERFEKLVNTYKGNENAICINKFIEFDGMNTLDNLLDKTGIPKTFDVLSVDIDGNDYHIWDSLKEYSPRVVVIEFNPTIPPDLLFVQPRDMEVNQGSSLLSLVNLGKSKGYELVSCTQLNAIFVKDEYFKLFDIEDNSPSSLFKDTRYLTKIFQLYDGTVIINGFDMLGWHGIKLRHKFLQPLPRFFRMFPDNMGVIRKFLFKIYRKIYNKL